MFESLTRAVAALGNVAFVWPLRALYFRGPAILQWGFWQGTAPHDICAQLTSISASSWVADQAHKKECLSLLDKKFDTFLVGTSVAVYSWTLFSAISHIWMRLFVVGPVIHAIRASPKERVCRACEPKKKE